MQRSTQVPVVTTPTDMYHASYPLSEARRVQNVDLINGGMQAVLSDLVTDERSIANGTPWRFLHPDIQDNSTHFDIEHIGDPSELNVREKIAIHLVMADDYRTAEHFAVHEFTATRPTSRETLYSNFPKNIQPSPTHGA
jgi:hypothetical protein